MKITSQRDDTGVTRSAVIEYETLTDECPVCGVFGAAPCIDASGESVPDHDGRAVSNSSFGG